jgi:hypothetical protein
MTEQAGVVITIQTCVWELFSLNLSWGTLANLNEVFHGFSLSFQSISQLAPWLGHKRFLSKLLSYRLKYKVFQNEPQNETESMVVYQEDDVIHCALFRSRVHSQHRNLSHMVKQVLLLRRC